MNTEDFTRLLIGCGKDLQEAFDAPAAPAAQTSCVPLPALDRAANEAGRLEAAQWGHVMTCPRCASALAHLRGVTAAVILDLGAEDIITPLADFPATPVLAQAAGGEAAESEERGLVNLFMPPTVYGTKVEAFDAERAVKVVVPCADRYASESPRIELVMATGSIRTAVPEKREERLHDEWGGERELEAWVVEFEDVEPGRALVLVSPARRK